MRLLPIRWFDVSPSAPWRAGLAPVEMETSMPIRLRAGEKLIVLRRLDRTGRWESLDDRRQCLRCGALFRGRKVDVVGGTRGLGPLRLICPTEGCASSADEWMQLPRKRSRSNVLRAGPLPKPSSQSLRKGAIKKLVRFFHPGRAGA